MVIGEPPALLIPSPNRPIGAASSIRRKLGNAKVQDLGPLPPRPLRIGDQEDVLWLEVCESGRFFLIADLSMTG
jgi:hypothetical protein